MSRTTTKAGQVKRWTPEQVRLATNLALALAAALKVQRPATR